MGSENAELVAKDVISKVRKGEKIVLGKIIKNRGYSEGISKQPSRVKNTKSYQRVIKPLVDRLEEERNAIIERLKVTRNKAKYRDLIDGFDKVTKNIQLLTGGVTENVGLDGLKQSLQQLSEKK